MRAGDLQILLLAELAEGHVHRKEVGRLDSPIRIDQQLKHQHQSPNGIIAKRPARTL